MSSSLQAGSLYGCQCPYQVSSFQSAVRRVGNFFWNSLPNTAGVIVVVVVRKACSNWPLVTIIVTAISGEPRSTRHQGASCLVAPVAWVDFEIQPRTVLCFSSSIRHPPTIVVLWSCFHCLSRRPVTEDASVSHLQQSAPPACIVREEETVRG